MPVRLAYAVLVGLVGAGLVHIAILLLLPDFSQRDAWSRLAMVSDVYRFVDLDRLGGSEPVVRADDPLFRAAACRFDLADGLVQISTPGNVPYWSVSIYDRSGQNVYSFNDRIAEGRVLDFVVLTPAQMLEVRKEFPEEVGNSIFVEIPIGEGILVVRGFVPDSSWDPAMSSFLGEMSCVPTPSG